MRDEDTWHGFEKETNVGAPTNRDVAPMTLDRAVAIFKYELPNWVWSVTECWVSIRGYCAPDWIPGYQDHEDYGIEQVELEIAKPSGPRHQDEGKQKCQSGGSQQCAGKCEIVQRDEEGGDETP